MIDTMAWKIPSLPLIYAEIERFTIRLREAEDYGDQYSLSWLPEILQRRIAERDALEVYIASIPDDVISQACAYHYCAGQPWHVVAKQIGKNFGADEIAQRVDDYINASIKGMEELGVSALSSVKSILHRTDYISAAKRPPTVEELDQQRIGADILDACEQRGCERLFSRTFYTCADKYPLDETNRCLALLALTQKEQWESCLSKKHAVDMIKQWRILLEVLLEMRPEHEKADEWKQALDMLN